MFFTFIQNAYCLVSTPVGALCVKAACCLDAPRMYILGCKNSPVLRLPEDIIIIIYAYLQAKSFRSIYDLL